MKLLALQDLAGAHAEWANQTTLHPLGFAATVVLGLATLVLPRRFAVMPILVMACFVASAQRVVVLELDFSLLRLMVLFGWSRIILRREIRELKWTALDSLLVAWVVTGTLLYTVQQADTSAFIYKCGESFDAIGTYFLFRIFIRDWSDVNAIARFIAMLALPAAGFFVLEKATGRNVFAVFGGVPEFTMIREGKLRAQGAFSHAILAGCFWAALFPMLLAIWNQCAKRAAIGAAAILLIVLTCASSTPMASLAAIAIACLFFPLRGHMSVVRWATAFLLVGLHFSMQAPVWHLISRIDLVGGSTGWHRYYLIDQAIHHFSEWALLGGSSAHWGLGLRDVTNQFVLEGLRGGAATLLLFTVQIVLAFKYVGELRSRSEPNRADVFRSWCLGVMLFVHCCSFIAVSYFGQIYVVWYLTLAMIVSLRTAPSSVLSNQRVAAATRIDLARRHRLSRPVY